MELAAVAVLKPQAGGSVEIRPVLRRFRMSNHESKL